MLTTEIRVSRRSFLAGAAAASAAVAAGYPSPAAAKTVPRREERRRVVVLGSGFGGAITTMRLTEAGIPVTLIERGQRWPVGKANAFPTVAKLDRRVTWMRSTGSIWPGVVPPSTGTGYPVSSSSSTAEGWTWRARRRMAAGPFPTTGCRFSHAAICSTA